MIDAEQCWAAVASRDARADGAFVYAGRTTGVYCRPGCASRLPRRDNVAFYEGPAAAERCVDGWQAARLGFLRASALRPVVFAAGGANDGE